MTKPIDPTSAIETMWKTAPKLAAAKAHRIYLEEYKHSLKALLMKRSDSQTAAGQERDAYASDEYIIHLQSLKAAVEAEEKLRWQMVATEAAIQVWRSMESSNRMIDKATA